ncbi:hypothetical protein GQ473_00550 [archaeon]|nr:hypothetical protein [archaeon]
MKKTNILILFMFVIFFSFNIPISAEPMEMIPIDEIALINSIPTKTNSIANITFDSNIGIDNIENSNYKINLKNLKNETAQITIRLNWQIKPQNITATINNAPINIIKESEYYNNVRYKIQTNILPENEKTIDLSYTILKIPNQWNLGLWALDYNYNSPININFDYNTNEYPNTKITYTGNINFDYPPYKPTCNNCIYENNNVKITDTNYFYINWQKQRTPIRAMSVYLIMVFAIIYGLIKKRNIN